MYFLASESYTKKNNREGIRILSSAVAEDYLAVGSRKSIYTLNPLGVFIHAFISVTVNAERYVPIVTARLKPQRYGEIACIFFPFIVKT